MLAFDHDTRHSLDSRVGAVSVYRPAKNQRRLNLPNGVVGYRSEWGGYRRAYAARPDGVWLVVMPIPAAIEDEAEFARRAEALCSSAE